MRRHQHAVVVIAAALLAALKPDGGLVYPAPTDVVFSDDTVVEPDVVALSADAARDLVNPAHVDVHVLQESRYGAPVSLDGDERLRLDVAPGLTLPVADVLAG